VKFEEGSIAVARAPKPPVIDESRVRALLEKYDCPTPFHAVRTRFLGSIASPDMTVSPMGVLKGLWGGELPPFESVDALNELIDVMINGLWNSLTRHQKRSSPFRLSRPDTAPSRSGFSIYSRIRTEEIDSFFEGTLNGSDEIYLPEKANAGMSVLAEMRAMIAGIYDFAEDPTKAGTDAEFAATLKKVRELTPIMENEINTVVLSCTRARRQAMNAPDSPRSSFH